MQWRLRHISSRTKILVAIFVVVLIPALILGVLGFITLHRWEQTARQVMAESYVKTATMTVEKVEETLRRREEELFHRIGDFLRREGAGDGLHEAIKKFESQGLLGGVLYVLDTEGRVIHPRAHRLVTGASRRRSWTGCDARRS